MGVPTIPCLPNNEQRQVYNSLMISIALEETALAAIMNGEAEKIQAMAAKMNCACPPSTCEVLEFQKGVADILKLVLKKEILLELKLGEILDAKNRDCPPHPYPPHPCPPGANQGNCGYGK